MDRYSLRAAVRLAPLVDIVMTMDQINAGGSRRPDGLGLGALGLGWVTNDEFGKMTSSASSVSYRTEDRRTSPIRSFFHSPPSR